MRIEPPRYEVIRPGGASLRPVYRVAGATEAGLEEVAGVCLEWVRDKWAGEFPADGLGGCEVHRDGESLETVREGGHWALRLRQPDAPIGDGPAVAGRSWLSEIGLAARRGGGTEFAMTVGCASRRWEDPEPMYLRPRVVRDVARRFGLRGEWAFSDDAPWVGAEEFAALVRGGRRHDVVAVRGEVEGRHTSAEALAIRLLGWARVVRVSDEAAERWREAAGRDWAIPPGTVRLFRPEFDPARDAEFLHPVYASAEIAAWRTPHGTGPEAFARTLADRIGRDHVGRATPLGGCRFVGELRATPDGEARRAIAQAEASAAAARAEVEILRQRLAALERERDALRAEVLRRPVPAEDAPEDWDALVAWSERRHAGRIVWTPQARRGLAGARYADVARAASALDLLAGPFLDAKEGRPGAAGAFEAGLAAERQRCAPLSAAELRRTGTVAYPEGSGERLSIGFALKGRDGLRVYFGVDEWNGRVVLGALPDAV